MPLRPSGSMPCPAVSGVACCWPKHSWAIPTSARAGRADDRTRHPEQRARLRDILGQAGQKATVLISTHQTDDVAALCERVVVLDGGRVHFDGTVGDFVRMADGRVWMAPERYRPATPGGPARVPGATLAIRHPAWRQSTQAWKTPTCSFLATALAEWKRRSRHERHSARRSRR